MRAKGILPEDNPMSLGVFGMGGTLWANEAIVGAETVRRTQVLFVLGATLNENNTLLGSAPFPTGENNLILVDINPNSNRDIESEHRLITADIKEFLTWLDVNKHRYKTALEASAPERKKWISSIKSHPRYQSDLDRTSSAKPIHPARAIADLRKIAPRNTVVVADSGAHTFFTGHHWESFGPNEFLFLSTTGPMGYGIAVGIGASFARPKQPCICIVGDGSMLMHGMELRTAVRYEIPLIVVVINNEALGNVYLRLLDNGQKTVAEKIASIKPRVDWVAFAKSVGADGTTVEEPGKLEAAYQKAFEFVKESNNKRPYVIDVICHNIYKTPNTNPLSKPVAKRLARSLRMKEGQAIYNWHS
jgi:acetolactate synthase-1/2/3 large subunit